MKRKNENHWIIKPILALVFSFPIILSLTDLSFAQDETSDTDFPEVCESVTIHYRRRNNDYDGWGLHVWGSVNEDITWENPLLPASEDNYGIVWEVEMAPDSKSLNYLIHKGEEKDPGPDQIMVFAETGCSIWLVQGKEDQFTNPDDGMEAMEIKSTQATDIGPDQVVIHYRRINEDYDGWGLHIWGPTSIEGVTWASPHQPTGQDDFGIHWIIDMEETADHLNYIVHRGDEKDPGPDQRLTFEESGREIWLIQGSSEQFPDPESALQGLLIAGVGDITNKAQAFWLTEQFIAWPTEFGSKAVFTLHHDPVGNIEVIETGLKGGQEIVLEYYDNDLPKDLAEKYPHLATAILLKIPDQYLDEIPGILKGQTAISVKGPDRSILGATGIQAAGVLDDLYANKEQLGVIVTNNQIELRVWAPTAKSVELYLFESSQSDKPMEILDLTWDTDTGIWGISGSSDWLGMYYLFKVEVYVRQEGKVVENLVTDPYSISLSKNSSMSHIVDLNNPSIKPDNWDSLEKPHLESPLDIVLYELHVRDFSAIDESVPEEIRGTYFAFTEPGSTGMNHLERLSQAGITHVHLLPTFDIATINEEKQSWQSPDQASLKGFSASSPEQQAVIAQTRSSDGFNWGYDPLHYSTPEGSYSTNPDSQLRIMEYRQMIASLNSIGLRVVMDVVYNHTNASGQSPNSVLDRIVPGYYHRLDLNGNVTTSTCCANTATEHAMMEKLMIDSILTWATQYKVDGFRFDLMGHHMKSNMENVRNALDGLTLAHDGVDGKSIYIYGEGWDFGEVASNARGSNASQLNMGGTGIGTFNDRIRDAVRGGNPFEDPREQGFATGLFFLPNDFTTSPVKSQLSSLLDLKDHIRLGIVGNLANFRFINAEGNEISGAQIDYNGHQAGYAHSPAETINYISAHDNETWFDAIQYKAPTNLSMDDRLRIDTLGLSIVAYSQGIPFFHAGSEILRSKSFDRDSYDSGDWFNALDWTYSTNNWGKGLPIEDKNGSMWTVIEERLSLDSLSPSPENIMKSLQLFEEMLRVRSSSPLFRLNSGDDVLNQIRFLNTGTEQIPGLIVMEISDNPENRIDNIYDQVYVLINSDPNSEFFELEDDPGSLELHPILASSQDPIVRTASYNTNSHTFEIPGLTAAVFVHQNPLSHVIDETKPTEQETPVDDKEIIPLLESPNKFQTFIGILLSFCLATLTGLWFVISNTRDEIQ